MPKLSPRTPKIFKKKTDAQKLVKQLIETHRMRELEIALALDVHPQSVTRWRDGLTVPHGSNLRDLEALHTKKTAKKK